MSRDCNAILKVSLGISLLGATVIFPLPGESAGDRPLEVGDSVLVWPSDRGRPWEVIAFNPPRDTAILARGKERAIMAVWECRLVE